MQKLWLNRRDVLVLTGLRDKSFRANIQAALESNESRQTAGRGQPLQFWAPAVVQRLIATRLTVDDDDPFLTGPDSPALERYRTARASLAELELETRRGDSMRRTEVREGLAAIAGIYRRGDARLQREFGPEAYQIVDETWDDAQRMIDRKFGPDTGAESNEP